MQGSPKRFAAQRFLGKGDSGVEGAGMTLDIPRMTRLAATRRLPQSRFARQLPQPHPKKILRLFLGTPGEEPRRMTNTLLRRGGKEKREASAFTPSVTTPEQASDVVTASRAVETALGQETARTMRRFQVRRRQKAHRALCKKAPAHPSGRRLK